MTQTPTDALRLVPDDYVLVPREPTGAMLKAAFAAMNATPSGTWKRGAEEWCRLNYPQWVEWLEACHAPAAPTGDA